MFRDHKFGSLINDNNDLSVKYDKQNSKSLMRNGSVDRRQK